MRISAVGAIIAAGIIFAVAIFTMTLDNVEEDKTNSDVQPTQEIEPTPEPKTESIAESKLTSTPPSIQLSAEPMPALNCLGTAQCFIGTVTKIIDGDTIHVDGQSIRFALSSAPEIKGYGGIDSRNFIETLCPVGSIAVVDEDDGQILGSYGRLVGKITCNDINLNSELLDANLGYLELRFCDSSEFSSESWAVKHGCDANSDVVSTSETVSDEPAASIPSCDPSYPDVCIAPYPPDLDCGDIPQKKFAVLQPDPHRFDGDKDGIGCE